MGMYEERVLNIKKGQSYLSDTVDMVNLNEPKVMERNKSFKIQGA